LNSYASLGLTVHRKVRAHLQELLRSGTTLAHVLRDDDELRANAFVPMEDVTMHLPMNIAEFTDYFTSPYHAKNVSPMQPNDSYQPIM
jgi:fumarylacetoacetase